MRSLDLLLASSLFAASQAAFLLPRDEKSKVSCGDIDITQLRDPERSKEIWEQSKAGQIGDSFISNNGLEHWVQDFDQEIFDDEDNISDSWDCTGWDTMCELKKDCGDYRESGEYFLYYSLQQFRTFTSSFHERLQDDTIREILDIFRVQGDFEWHEDGDLNVPILIAGGLGIMAGFVAFNPLLAGILGVAAGMAVIMGNVDPPAAPIADTGDKELGVLVQSAFEQMRDAIGNIDGAVLGNPGYGADLIPAEAQVGTKHASPAMGVLGDGRWLRADPTEGLTEAMDKMFYHMRQALAWAMMRHARHSFVFIDQPVEEHECGYNYNMAIWDPDEGFCFRLFHVNDKDEIEPVPNELSDKLWAEPYNIDKLGAYRNAYHCWIDNDGKAGDPTFVEDLGEDEVPPCWFSMVVVKGTYYKMSKSIKMFEFTGQTDGNYWEPTW